MTRAAINRTCAIFILGLFPGLAARAADVNLAVAANFTAPMDKISKKFTEKTGHKLLISYGSTGKLFAQIKNGAPFEVFLSADQEHPKKMIQDGSAVAGSERTYAVGKLVLWSPKAKVVDADGNILKKGAFKHLSIAQSKLAPYGAAAQQVLEKMGIWEKLQGRLVMGESITQAHQFVATGNAEIGFIALSQIKKESERIEGSYWLVPPSLYSTLQQDVVLLMKGKESAAAKQFLEFLKSDEGKLIIQKSGYDLE